MASPPITPTKFRRQSGDYFSGSPITRVASSTHSRHSSQAYSPAHSRMSSSHTSDNLATELGGFGESLADELNGWGQDEEDEEEEFGSEEEEGEQGVDGERERDSGIDVTSSPATKENGQLLTVTMRSGKGQRRKGSDYDGSEYGTESDFEDAQLVSASLEARLSAVESLARRGTGDISGIENTMGRATQQLQDLGGQSGIETGTSRFTTANKAIVTHLGNQTRVFQQLTATLLSPLAPPLPTETVDEIIPEIDACLTLLADLVPSTAASSSLRSLIDSTADLVDALNTLSDSVHIMRETSATASRRLRGVREALREWRIESITRAEGIAFLEQGSWDKRLQQRECASACRDVLNGFEEVCDAWRERLFSQRTGTITA